MKHFAKSWAVCKIGGGGEEHCMHDVPARLCLWAADFVMFAGANSRPTSAFVQNST